MNANAILALIGDLYAQLAAAQDRIAELEQELQASQASGENGPARTVRAADEPKRAAS